MQFLTFNLTRDFLKMGVGVAKPTWMACVTVLNRIWLKYLKCQKRLSKSIVALAAKEASGIHPIHRQVIPCKIYRRGFASCLNPYTVWVKALSLANSQVSCFYLCFRLTPGEPWTDLPTHFCNSLPTNINHV